ncbi:bifunctional diaminohydroxyphosphoribosylaminopyrimidine deaminase/5-amino-6-(5-phosphoribosylamino)uracil reductase RibD [Vibrio sp. WJH972]
MSEFSLFDYKMMNRAIHLAKQGRFTTAPNPNVGCVITNDEHIVGEGYHAKAGEPHAEVHALRQAGAKAKGATAYVTLEPCSHYGRTPPCAEGLIKAGIVKVVCAMSDPNPLVAGNGFQMLRNAGIDVAIGLLESDAAALNPGFIKKMSSGLPYVQLKMAATLDGQTALANGKSQWITSAAARQDVQAYRAIAGAILSTSQTVIADNASLAVRWHELPDSIQANYPESQLRQPLRVILDRQQKLTPDLRIFNDGSPPIMTVAEKSGDIIVDVDSQKQLNLETLLKTLATEQQVNHVWVEAGATLAGSMIRQNLVDDIVLYLAPKLIGSDGRGLFGKLGLTEMSDVIDLEIQELTKVGPDIRIVVRPQYKN